MVLLPVGELVWMRGGWLPLNTSLLKEKQKTPLDDSGRATSLSVGQPWLQLLNLRVKGYISWKLSLKWIQHSWTGTVAE